jgi:hypothetical protein
MTPEQRESRIRSLVSAARAVLSLQVGLAVGANRIVGILWRLGPEFEDAHPIFDQCIRSIPPVVPIGGARLLWASDNLMKTDKVLAKREGRYRKPVLLGCIQIIKKYG